MSKELFCHNGDKVLIDDDDYPFLKTLFFNRARSGYVYTVFQYRMDNQMITCPHSLHSIINKTPKGKHTDHINGDQLDNRKENLRIVTPKQNCTNIHNPVKNKTGYPGVFTKIKPNGTIKYRSKIVRDGVTINLGYYKTPEDAHAIYAAAKEKIKTENFKN